MALTSADIEQAAHEALAGGLVVFPTDTVYGLGGRPDDAAVTTRIFQAKGRARHVALPVLADSIEVAGSVALFDDAAERVASACWPGALTLVLARSETSRGWDLGGDDDRTVAIRVPAHPVARALLSATGPLAVTSANRSGEPPATTCADLADAFGALVSAYLCEAGHLEGDPSTVLDLAHGDPVVLRPGGVSGDTIRRWLPRGTALLDSPPSS